MAGNVKAGHPWNPTISQVLGLAGENHPLHQTPAACPGTARAGDWDGDKIQRIGILYMYEI